ncbi:amidohydrolase family protein [Phyllobacterium sophorae]|uniref:Amidohydrolase n=1 Tax=Phyllobacterium sophorae TaxID=1520277 RepID=A0A2P7B6Q5_9HYPH|nr:amidohydrolase family protein [Phyllobacterium sophorae]PSH62138.1 amidohydrolase [Phyllobacterium sophorae]
MTVEVIDAQLHLNYLGIEPGLAAMDAVGIDGAIVDLWPLSKSTLPNGAFRCSYLLAEEAARRFPDRFAYVARIDHRDPDLDDMVGSVRSVPGRLGIRIDQPSADTLRDGGHDKLFAAAEKYNVPTWVILPNRLKEIEPYVRRFQTLPFVIDHAGMPLEWDHFSPTRFEPLQDLLALAVYSNVSVKWGHVTKLSADAFPYPDVLAQLRRVVDAFGPERVMWESDATLSAGYQTWAEALFSVRSAELFDDSEKQWLLGRTAKTIMRWDRPDFSINHVVVADDHWNEYQLRLAGAGAFPHKRVSVSRASEVSAPLPGERTMSTVALPNVKVASIDDAVRATIEGVFRPSIC